MAEGYVKIWRKSLKNGWLGNPVLWTFWTWCLMSASYQTRTEQVGFQRIVLEPGQLVFSYRKASLALRVNPQQIRTCVDHLKNWENITIKSTNKYSIISIINWDIYQGEEKTNNKQERKQGTSKAQATNTLYLNKEGKEGKEEKIESGGVGVVPDWIPIQIWKDWKEFRIRKKAPLTDRAAKKTIEELGRLRDAGNDPEAVLEQSIYRGWTGVFALKSDFKKASPQTRAEKVRASMEIMARREYERQAQEDREEKGHRPCSDPDVCLLPDRGL